MNEERKRFLKFSIISAAVFILVEIFVFNINSFHVLSNKYKLRKLDLSDKKTVSERGYIYLEWNNLDMPVGTVMIDAESDIMPAVNVTVDMADDTNREYRSGIAGGTVISGNGRSRVIVCNFSGKVHKLRIRINASEDELIKVNEVMLNKTVPFRFSFIRFLLLFGGSLIIYILLYSVFMNKAYSENTKASDILLYGITGLFAVAAFGLILTGKQTYNITYGFLSKTGNQLTKELVDAFRNGQVSLLEKPSEELLALENPYDLSQRHLSGEINYLWDHLLYNGKYYSYYGIAPVLLLFLPYNLITGYYFSSAAAVFIFGIIGIVFLTKIYMWVIRKFFRELNNNIIVMGLIMLQLVTGVWFCFNVPNFYEIAQTSGFAAVTAGIYFLLSSGIITDGAVSKKRVAAGTTLLALAVMCRPTLALYCIVSLIALFAGYRKCRKENAGRKEKIQYILCALLPYVIIGSVQMAYNYIRFGSVLDFGIKYSLTINDFINAEYHTHFVWISFYNYILKFPGISAGFPFVKGAGVELFNVNGYYYVATNTAAGLLWKALPLSAYAYGIKAYRRSENPDKKLYLWLIAAGGILVPFIIIFSIWESGYGARYSVDFAWEMLIGAFSVAFAFFIKSNAQTKKILTRLMLIATIICVVINFGQIYEWLLNVTGFTKNETAVLMSFGRLFEFWK